MINRKLNIIEMEIDEKELLQISMLKKDLLKLFNDYKSSRTGLMSFFMNGELTYERLKIADQAIKFIKGYEGTKKDFIEQLKQLRIENADLSRQYNKFHYNLLDKREHYNRDGSIRRTVNKGESSFKSGLADAFHDAINKAAVSTIEDIRNNRKR